MWLGPAMKEDNAESNREYSGTIVRGKVAVLAPVASLFLGINQGHIPRLVQDGVVRTSFLRVCLRGLPLVPLKKPVIFLAETLITANS